MVDRANSWLGLVIDGLIGLLADRANEVIMAVNASNDVKNHHLPITMHL